MSAHPSWTLTEKLLSHISTIRGIKKLRVLLLCSYATVIGITKKFCIPSRHTRIMVDFASFLQQQATVG
jgi:hypothetical protein